MDVSKDSEYLIGVYEDTLNLCKKDNVSPANLTINKYKEKDCSIEPSEIRGEVEIVNCDSVTALTRYKDQGKVCILNMASRTTYGGGVAKGSKAQEEDLFRCSNLGLVSEQDLYPLDYDEGLYSTGVVFVKDCNYQPMDKISCDVVTVPAFKLKKDKFAKNYREGTMNKIRLMLSLAVKNNVDVLILGAWGCGVFKNDPGLISGYFRKVLDEGYSSHFKKIVFAIINDDNSVGSNFEIFEKKFKTWNNINSLNT